MNHRYCWLFALLLPILAPVAVAHSKREDYLIMEIAKDGSVTGRFELHAKDLKETLAVEIDHSGPNGSAVLASAEQSAPEVHDYIRTHYRLEADGTPIEFQFSNISFVNEVGTFVQYHFTSRLASLPATLHFEHSMFYESDPLHRGLFVLTHDPVGGVEYGEVNVALVFSSANRIQDLPLGEPLPNYIKPSGFPRKGLLAFFRGIDHILFIVVLLLPTVLRREGTVTTAEPGFLAAAIRAGALVAAFTLAHGLGLGLAAQGKVLLPNSVVDLCVALTVILAALANFFPWQPRILPWLAAVLVGGFFHGLALAVDLAQLPYRLEHLKEVLLRFTVGLECAHLAIVVPVFLLCFALRRAPFYQSAIVRGLSALALLFGAYRAISLGT